MCKVGSNTSTGLNFRGMNTKNTRTENVKTTLRGATERLNNTMQLMECLSTFLKHFENHSNKIRLLQKTVCLSWLKQGYIRDRIVWRRMLYSRSQKKAGICLDLIHP